MYQKCPCNRNGLGFITELVGAYSALTDEGGGEGAGAGAGGAGGAATSTVSPQISTQISPQISPIFQQQFQPQNSAATAGTTQALPSMPAMTGAEPAGGMIPTGIGMPGYAQPAPVPQVPQVPTDWARYMPYALAGLGILAFVSVRKKKAK